MKNIDTILDYLHWRGDLSFAQDPFNEVDSLILSMACFVDFQGIVPPPGAEGSVSFLRAMERFDADRSKPRHMGVIIPEQTLEMARRASRCPRYANAGLFAFENKVDESREMQFAAVTFRLSDGSLFLAFRGTDDTIVGWKEDFNMYFLPYVPAQAEAAAYLNTVARQSPGPIRTGGHSKGGNLAIWAVVHADPAVRKRVLRAYSNDGPGFQRELLESPAYQEMRERCITYVPQSSLVGMLMEHDENVQIIYSAETGLLQHDPFSWDIDRNRFTYLAERSRSGEHSDAALRNWIDSMTPAEQRELIRDLFEVLESSGAKTLTELDENKVRTVAAMYKTLSGYDRPRRKRLNEIMERLISAQFQAAWMEIVRPER